MNNPFPCAIISMNGGCVGNLVCDIIPIDEDGNEFDDVPDDPLELVGQQLTYKVYIKEANELPENFCKNAHVEYETFHDNFIHKTKEVNGKTSNPVFDEYIEHRIEYLTKQDIEHMLKENVFNIIIFKF